MDASWQSWKTSQAGDDSVAFWADVVMRGVIDATMEPVERECFNGELASRTVGDARFVNFRTHSHRIHRSATQARGGHGLIMVGLQCSGVSLMDQGDSQIQLLPGQIAMIDSNAPFDLLFPETVERRLVLLPRSELAAVCGENRLSGAPIVMPSRNGSLLLAQDAIMRLTDTSAAWSEDDCSAMIEALVSLLGSCLEQSEDAPGNASARLSEILVYMEKHLDDADLKPMSVAQSVSLSPRSLYRLFAASGKTFSRTLLDLRLAHARKLILRNADRSLTDIALHSGFCDSAHFSRSYRAAFGEAPSQTRARNRVR